MDAYLLSPDTRKVMWLGRVIEKPDSGDSGRVEYFHRGPEEGPLNHEDPELNATVWKFLAEHALKSLRIVYAGEYDEDEYELVGSGDVETAEYLRGWPVEAPKGFRGMPIIR